MKVLSQHVLLIILTAMGIFSTTTDLHDEGNAKSMKHSSDISTQADNPLLAEWAGPYGGVPPFDKVKVEYFQPALEAGMKERLEETEKIASLPARPTLENTIAALERSRKTMEPVLGI